ALVDFLSGIALRARRGRAVTPAAAVSRKSVSKTEPPVPEPHFDPAPTAAPITAPAPAPSTPAAASVAEAVLQDHPEPGLAQPVAASSAVSPEVVPSPDLQPGSGSSPSPEEPPR
ncbi:MAG: hypothetical protein ACREDY_27035, partial [Bradyrhizobium sp.]